MEELQQFAPTCGTAGTRSGAPVGAVLAVIYGMFFWKNNYTEGCVHGKLSTVRCCKSEPSWQWICLGDFQICCDGELFPGEAHVGEAPANTQRSAQK